jgi:CRP/FNR family transcriptional regulator, cyclic AMP receptor protein
VARDEKIDLLRTVPLFSGLDHADLKRVSTLADIVDLPADRLLMSQGQHGREMFVLVSGSARIERDGQSLGERGPGEVLGEIALLDGGPRTATVTLSEPSRLLVLARREFQALMDEFPDIRLRVLEAVAHRLRSLDPDGVH